MTTIEIAKRLGISRGTVSRVLNNHPNVKPQTKEMVLAELARCGYQPNEAARSLVMQRNHKFAVILFSEPRYFWKQVEYGIAAAESRLKVYGVTIDVYITDILKPEEQLELLRSLPQKEYDAFIVAPNDPSLLLEEIDVLVEKGTPVLLLNVDIPSANRLCYMGCNYTQSGTLGAEILAKCMGHKGNIAMLTLKDQVPAIEQRITGFRREIARNPLISIDQVLRFDRMGNGTYDAVMELLSSQQEITGLYVGFGALDQAAKAVMDSGKPREVQVVGYDLSEDIIQNLNEGTVTATICHEPFNQGYLGCLMMYNYVAKGVQPENTIMYSKLEAIFKSNAKYYLDGKRQFELLQI